jgi:large subunit ribosomal protein L10
MFQLNSQCLSQLELINKMSHAQTHVSQAKKSVVKDLEKLMKSKTVMVVSIKGLPAAQFQEIKKNLRANSKIRVAKKSLIDLALEESKNASLKELVKYVDADCALLFSEQDAFLISGTLADGKTPAKAKAGQVPQEDIWAEAGGTDLIPGPDISALSAVGLRVKVESGKLAIQTRAIVCKKGEPISPERAAILSKLNIIPFKNGIEPIAAYSDGKVYANIKINKEEFMKDFLSKYARAFAFAVNVPWLNAQTMPFILGKAASHEAALKSLIKTGDNQ